MDMYGKTINPAYDVAPLLDAVRKNDYNEVQNLLENVLVPGFVNAPIVNEEDNSIRPVIFYAVEWACGSQISADEKEKRREIIRLLVKHGADVNAKGIITHLDTDDDAYISVTSENIISTVACFYRQNYDFNVNYIIPDELLQDLIEYGLDVNARRTYWYKDGTYFEAPLIYTCLDSLHHGESAAIILLEHGAKLENEKIYTDCTMNGVKTTGNLTQEVSLLRLAAAANSIKMVKLLLEKGLDINEGSTHKLIPEMRCTPLHVATHLKFAEMIDFLLENNADPYLTNEWMDVDELLANPETTPQYITTVDMAVREGNPDVLEVFRKHGVEMPEE